MSSHLIKETLYNELRARQQCYVFIDRMTDWPLGEMLAQQTDKTIKQTPLEDGVFAQTPNKSPLIIRLQWQHAELLDRCVDITLEEALSPYQSGRSVCAFVFSDLSNDALCGRLRARLRITVRELGNVYLRYFDPSVTNALSRVLEPTQWASLLEGIACWSAINDLGQLDQHRPPSEKATETKTSWHFVDPITAQQWEQLELAHTQHRARFAARRDGVELTEKSAREINQLVKQAAKSGLTSVDDQIAYARFGIANDPANFAQKSETSQAIEFTKKSGATLADVFEQKFGLQPATASTAP